MSALTSGHAAQLSSLIRYAQSIKQSSHKLLSIHAVSVLAGFGNRPTDRALVNKYHLPILFCRLCDRERERGDRKDNYLNSRSRPNRPTSHKVNYPTVYMSYIHNFLTGSRFFFIAPEKPCRPHRVHVFL